MTHPINKRMFKCVKWIVAIMAVVLKKIKKNLSNNTIKMLEKGREREGKGKKGVTNE